MEGSHYEPEETESIELRLDRDKSVDWQVHRDGDGDFAFVGDEALDLQLAEAEDILTLRIRTRSKSIITIEEWLIKLESSKNRLMKAKVVEARQCRAVRCKVIWIVVTGIRERGRELPFKGVGGTNSSLARKKVIMHLSWVMCFSVVDMPISIMQTNQLVAFGLLLTFP